PLVVHIASDTHDLHVFELTPVVVDELADGALVRPERPRQRLTHDGHRRRALAIGVGERTSSDDRNRHRLEVTWRDGAHVADRLLPLRRRWPARHGEITRGAIAAERQEADRADGTHARKRRQSRLDLAEELQLRGIT